MKSACTLIVLFFLSAASFAQLEKGNFLVGGNISYNSNKTKPTDVNNVINSSFNFSPSAGYFVASNLAVGLEYNYYNVKSKSENTSINPIVNTQTNRSTEIGPFVRYYKSIGEKLALFGQGSLGYVHTVNSQEQVGLDPNYNFKNKGNGFYGRIKPGMTYFITKKFGLELTFGSLGYKNTNVKSDVVNDKTKNNDFNFNFGFNSLALGARFYL